MAPLGVCGLLQEARRPPAAPVLAADAGAALCLAQRRVWRWQPALQVPCHPGVQESGGAWRLEAGLLLDVLQLQQRAWRQSACQLVCWLHPTMVRGAGPSFLCFCPERRATERWFYNREQRTRGACGGGCGATRQSARSWRRQVRLFAAPELACARCLACTFLFRVMSPNTIARRHASVWVLHCPLYRRYSGHPVLQRVGAHVGGAPGQRCRVGVHAPVPPLHGAGKGRLGRWGPHAALLVGAHLRSRQHTIRCEGALPGVVARNRVLGPCRGLATARRWQGG